jgi:hypothetical protein
MYRTGPEHLATRSDGNSLSWMLCSTAFNYYAWAIVIRLWTIGRGGRAQSAGLTKRQTSGATTVFL